MRNNNYVFIGDISTYIDEISSVRKNQFTRLIQQADTYFSYELPKVHPNGSTTFMGLAIVNLALAYRVTKKEKYLAEAKRFMNTVIGYENWGNAHLVNVDLSASWILFGLSLGYDWLKEDMTQEERECVRNKIEHHADFMYQYKMDTYGKGWSTAFYQNHNWINLNGLATAGYVLEADGADAQRYIDIAKTNFERVFQYMPEDGSNYEGVVYWRYGGMWLFVYAHLLKEREEIDYFSTSEYLKNTFYYRLYQSAPDLEQQLNFGDCHDRHSGHTPCVYMKVAAEYGDGYAQTFADIVVNKFLTIEAENSKVKPGILPEAAFEFLWYDPTVEKKPLEELPKVRYFDDLGLLCVRSGWKRNDKVFSIKCSAPGGKKQWHNGWKLFYEEGIDCLALSHHHPDNLSYIYVDGSDYLTCEDGYNRNIMPDNHNVLLVDGLLTDEDNVGDVYMRSAKSRLKNEKTLDIENDYYGEVLKYIHEENIVCYKADTHKLYPKNIQMNKVTRTFFTDDLEFILFVDQFESDKEHLYQTISNTDMTAEHVIDNKYKYNVGEKKYDYMAFSEKEIFTKLYDQTVIGVMTTQEPDKVCRSDIKTLSFVSKSPTKSQVIFECIVPEESNLRVEYTSNCITIYGKKIYKCLTKEAYHMHGISSVSDICFIVEENNTKKVYEL